LTLSGVRFSYRQQSENRDKKPQQAMEPAQITTAARQWKQSDIGFAVK